MRVCMCIYIYKIESNETNYCIFIVYFSGQNCFVWSKRTTLSATLTSDVIEHLILFFDVNFKL